MKSYGKQVGGHFGTLFEGDGTILKTTNQREIDFYVECQKPQHAKLKRFLPAFHGHRLLDIPDKPNSLCVELVDVMHNVKETCAIDIKLGTRFYDDDSSIEKRARMEEQSKQTTSGSLGLRICGARVRHSKSGTELQHGKEYGRALTKESFEQGLYSLFQNNDNERVHVFVLEQLLIRINELRKAVKSECMRLYGASILIVFDGEYAWIESQVQKVSIYLIDFAHSHFEQDCGPDEAIILALDNLHAMVSKFINLI